MNTKILVCCHKQDVMATQEPYMPIHVGKALHPELDLGIQGDNTGDNISEKNGSYCELTGMYWAWKNLKDVDIIGLCHYRRYFDFYSNSIFGLPEKMFNTSHFDSTNFNIPEKILTSVNEGSVIVPKPIHGPISLYYDYCLGHISDDIRILEDIIRNQPDKIQKSYFRVMRQHNILYPYNMFIMNWNQFDLYCSWLFDILFLLEKRLDISSYNSYQKRVFGFVSERLFNVWLHSIQVDLIEKPIFWFLDNPQAIGKKDVIKSMIRSYSNDISVWLTRPKYFDNWKNEIMPKYLKL